MGVYDCDSEEQPLQQNFETLRWKSKTRVSKTLRQLQSNVSSLNSLCPSFKRRSLRSKRTKHIEMFDVLQQMKLDYPSYVWTHNGWVQEMDTTYSASQWDSTPLIVHIVPFSHADPGWRFTYESTYTNWCASILNVALNRLTENQDITFVWAEIIFLRRWYESLDVERQKQFKRLLKDRRFEILTGGWVMTDEAVAHYEAMLDQLIEGQQWLQQELDYRVEYAWAIDPFGHSPTMSYLLKRSGIKAMLIQRTHYATKKELAFKQQLEFTWKQSWDVEAANSTYDTGIFCHMSPYMLYNIQYSCGPDINVCCQFDFTHNKCWRWGMYKAPEAVNPRNIEKMANALLDQLRKKSQFFRHNHVLFPVGDDFRYTTTADWNTQFNNLSQLISFMNSAPDMNVQMKYSTLGRYLEAAQAQNKASHSSLSGDFFTYSDRSDQYWSGYFTSRPVLKNLARLLQSRLRASEILYGLASGYATQKSEIFSDKLLKWYNELVSVRQSLALCQHHDAITGTSRLDVINDYTTIVRQNLERCRSLISEITASLVYTSANTELRLIEDMFSFSSNAAAVPSVVSDFNQTTVVLFNPLAVDRITMVRLVIGSPYVRVYESLTGLAFTSCQINPIISRQSIIEAQKFELVFETVVPALGMCSYDIVMEDKQSPANEPLYCPFAKITVFNIQHEHSLNTPFQLSWDTADHLRISNQWLTVNFCTSLRLMQSVESHVSGVSHKVQSKFVEYGTGNWINPFQDKSGAYVFLPDGPAKETPMMGKPASLVLKGSLMSSVTTWFPFVSQTVFIYNGTSVRDGASIHIINTVCMSSSQSNNSEIAMRLKTSLLGRDFFTDLNGFQMYRRRTQSRLPLQGNFYPMTSAMFVEDDQTRLSLLSSHSHGVSSLHPGSIDVMLDRRLSQDDWRGLDEGVMDDLPSSSHFILALEQRADSFFHAYMDDERLPTVSYLSLLAQQLLNSLNNPVIPLSINSASVTTKHIPIRDAEFIKLPFRPLRTALPCDVHLVNLRALPPWYKKTSMDGRTVLLVLHRWGIDCDIQTDGQVTDGCTLDDVKVLVQGLFRELRISSVEESSLTGYPSDTESVQQETVVIDRTSLPRMEIKTWRITFQ